MAQTKDKIAELKDQAVTNAEVLYHYKLIARSIGRDEDTLIRWRKEDPEFADRLQVGRTIFIRKQMGRAKPDFLLERLERDIFGQKVVIEGGENPISILLQKYGLSGGEDARQDDGSVPSTSKGDPQS